MEIGPSRRLWKVAGDGAGGLTHERSDSAFDLDDPRHHEGVSDREAGDEQSQACRCGGFQWVSHAWCSFRYDPSSLLRRWAALMASTTIWGNCFCSMCVIASCVVPLGLVTFRRSSW